MKKIAWFLLAFGAWAEDARNTDIKDTHSFFSMHQYKTRAEWEKRARELRRQILWTAGLYPMPQKNPLSANVFGRIEYKDYSIEKVALETMPGYYLGGNLYRPLGRQGTFPAVASPHGHWAYGRLENQPLASIPTRCISLARQGYVAFAYDMVGYNDTVQTPHSFNGQREQLWSFGPLGLQLWNSIRVIDFLESLPDVDRSRIAMTGASGGGTQTFLATAVDDRVKFSAPVNMISSIMQGGSMCENAPGLRVGTNNMEIAALMAPRPMLMVSASGDWTKNTPSIEYPAVRSVYSLYDQTGNVETIQIDSPHNYNQASREAVYRFFGKHVLGEPDPRKFAEATAGTPRLQDMLVWHGRPLPPNALTYEQLLEQWIAGVGRQTEAASREELKERLTLALGAEWPAHVEMADGKALTRPGRGDRVPASWTPRSGPATLVIHPDGIEAARATPEAQAPGSVLLIDAFQTGSAVAPRNRSAAHFLCFNLSDDAHRVQDILTALRYLEQQRPGEIRLTGYGKAAVWCLFAAAVSKSPVKLKADLGGFTGTDQEFIGQFFVPGIQRAGGLKAARMVAAP